MTYAAYKCDLRRMHPSVWETANVSQTPLHIVSRKHVVQPGNRSKPLCTGVSLNLAVAFAIASSKLSQSIACMLVNDWIIEANSGLHVWFVLF